jgi:hypothetical protein
MIEEVFMNQQKPKTAERQPSTQIGSDQPASWGESLLALGPFLLVPVILLLAIILTPFLHAQNTPEPGVGFTFAFIGILLIVLIVGWVKAFPRWVFPYWGFVLLITLYFQNFTGTISGYPFRGSWRVWIPLLGVVIIGLLWTRNFQSLYRLLGSIWKDWTLISFTFYGALPLLYIAAYEEVRHKELVLSLVMLILAAAALVYMRSRTILQRFASLVVGFSLSWAVTMSYLSLYWNGRQEVGMGEPASWMETLSWTGRTGFTLMVILVAPVLIEVFHWMKRSLRSQNATEA